MLMQVFSAGFCQTFLPISSLKGSFISMHCHQQIGPLRSCSQTLSAQLCLQAYGVRLCGNLSFKAINSRRRETRHTSFGSATKLRSVIQRDLAMTTEIEGFDKDFEEYTEQLQEFHGRVEQMIEKGDEETARILIEANYEALKEQLEQGVDGVEQAVMLDILAQLCMSLQNFEDAEQMLDQMKHIMGVKNGNDIMEGIGDYEPLVYIILEHMGSMHFALGNKKEALFFYMRSLQIQEKLLGEKNPLLANTLMGLANAYRDLQQKLISIDICKRVIAILESSKGSDCEELAIPLSHLGHTLLEENRLDEAELQMCRALKLAQKTNRNNDGRVGVALCALARVKHAKDELDEATELFHRGLQILRNSNNMSPSNPIMECVRTEVAEFLSLTGRHKEAQKLWEENLFQKERLVGFKSPQLVIHLQNLATSYACNGKFEKCEQLLRRSLQLVEGFLGPRAPEVLLPLENLAMTLHNLERDNEAVELAHRAINIREAVFGPDDPSIGETCQLTASILHALGRNQEAVSLMWRDLHIKENELGRDNPALCETLHSLIQFLNYLGRTEEIYPLVERFERLAIKVS
eukprot:c20602_g1_i2 orf=156-1889(-)